MASQEWQVAKSEGSLLTFEFSNLLNVTFKTGKSLYRNMRNSRARMYLRTEIDKLQDDHGWKVKIFDDLRPELRVLKAAYMYNKSGTLRGLLKAELTREGNKSLLKHFGLKEICGKSPLDYLVRSLPPLKGQQLVRPFKPVVTKLSDDVLSASPGVDEVRNELSRVVRFLTSNPFEDVLHDDTKILVRYHNTIDLSCEKNVCPELGNLSADRSEAIAITDILCSLAVWLLVQNPESLGGMGTAESQHSERFLILEPKLVGGRLFLTAYSERKLAPRGKLAVAQFGLEENNFRYGTWSEDCDNSFLLADDHPDPDRKGKGCVLHEVWNARQQMHYVFLARTSHLTEGISDQCEIQNATRSVVAEGDRFLTGLHDEELRYSVHQHGLRVALVVSDAHSKAWTIKHVATNSVTVSLCAVHWKIPRDEQELAESVFWNTGYIPVSTLDYTGNSSRDDSMGNNGTLLEDFLFLEHVLAVDPAVHKTRRMAIERCKDVLRLGVLAESVYKLAGCLVEQLESDFNYLMEAIEDIRAQRILRGLEEGVTRRFDIGLVFEYDKLGMRTSSLSRKDATDMITKGRRALGAQLDLFEDDDILSDAVLEAYLNASRQDKCTYVRADDKSIDKEWVNEAYGYGFTVPCRSKTSTIVVDATDNFYIGLPSCKTAIAIYKSSTQQQRVTSGDIQLFQSVSSSRARKALLELCAVLRPDPTGKIQYSEHARQELLAAANSGLIFSLGRVVDALRDQVYRNRKVWKKQKIDFRDIMEEAYRIAKLDSDEERAWLGRELASVYARLGMFEQDTPYRGLIQAVSKDFCSGIGEINFTEPLRGDGILIKEHHSGKLISGTMMLRRDGCWMGTPKYNVGPKKGRLQRAKAAESFRRSFIASCIESDENT